MIEKVRCWAVRNVLDLYVDARLTPSRRAAVKAHVRDCASCRAEVEALGGAHEFLASAKAIPVPAGLAQSILERLGEEPALMPAPGSLWPSPGQAAALAALALVLVAQRGPGLDSQAYAPLPATEESQ